MKCTLVRVLVSADANGAVHGDERPGHLHAVERLSVPTTPAVLLLRVRHLAAATIRAVLRDQALDAETNFKEAAVRCWGCFYTHALVLRLYHALRLGVALSNLNFREFST